MRTTSARNHRRGLFLALESLAGTAALLLDERGNLEYANQQACDLLGCAGEPALGEKWKAIAPLFDLPAAHPACSPSPRACAADMPSPAGSIPLMLQLHALHEDAGGGHFALLKDRSVLEPLEHELLLASERRAWSHQCETLTHDLKGILNSMQISLELLSDGNAEPAALAPEDARRQRRVATLKEDLVRMTRALRALPGADGDAQPAITQFDARELITEIFAPLRQLVRRNNVELKLELAEVPLAVRGRRPWLKQALFNVAVHRLNAMRAGGRLAVHAAATDLGVVVNLRNDAPDATIDETSRAFWPGRHGGGATDLDVARSIFESHGGALEIQRGSSDGTVFVIRLPH